MDIKGLDYTVFAFIRTLIGDERQRVWLEFAAGLTLDDNHLAQLREEMKADMNCESLLGVYNIILARIAEAESQIQFVLSKRQPDWKTNAEIDEATRDRIVSRVLKQVVKRTATTRFLHEIFAQGWEDVEDLPKLTGEAIREIVGHVVSGELLLQLMGYMVESTTGQFSIPKLVIDPQIDVELREQAQVKVCGEARYGYEGEVVRMVLEVAYKRLGIAIDGEAITPRWLDTTKLLFGGKPYDDESESEDNDDN